MALTLLFLVLFASFVFEYINGFHDTANAIATVVSTKVLTPRQAVLWAAFWNLVGAFAAMIAGSAVAKTISSGLVDAHAVTMVTMLAALIGAIVWNILTWWVGLPSSSSHALIGGLCGAAIATAGNNWGVLIWAKFDGHKQAGLWPKVVAPMITSPLVGFIGGAALMFLLLALLRKVRPRVVGQVFGKAQLVSAGFMGFSHGSNDAQKTMGIITLSLFTATQAGALEGLPSWLGFLHQPTSEIPSWVIITCALTMAAGTAAGGWRIIKTMGHKMVKLQPVHGFAAETTAAAVIHVATSMGIPLSTTHVISTSIMGVGASKRLSAVKWGVVGRIVWAWVLTLPITALIGFLSVKLLHACGLQ